MRRAIFALIPALALTALVAAEGQGQAPGQGQQAAPPRVEDPVGRGGRGGRGRGVAIEAGQECPAGMTLVRVGQCQPPDFPPPSIVDYRPNSSLVVEQTPVPRAKVPVVDILSHVVPTAQTMGQLVREMDALNLRVLETRDEYFDYYRPYHAFWKMYGLDLPDEVLRKVYYQNALRVTPGLPRNGWPR